MHPDLVKLLRAVAIALLAEAIRNLIEVNLPANRFVSRAIHSMKEEADRAKLSKAIVLHEEAIRNLIEANHPVNRFVSRAIHLMKEEADRAKLSKAIVLHGEAIRNLIEANHPTDHSVSQAIRLTKEAADLVRLSRVMAHHGEAMRNLAEINLKTNHFVNRTKSSVKDAAAREVHFQNPVKSFSRVQTSLQTPEEKMMLRLVKVFQRVQAVKHLLINHAEKDRSRKDFRMKATSVPLKNQEQEDRLMKQMKNQEVLPANEKFPANAGVSIRKKSRLLHKPAKYVLTGI